MFEKAFVSFILFVAVLLFAAAIINVIKDWI